MAKYSYVDKAGKEQTGEFASEAEALKAPNIGERSGVRLIQDAPAPTPAPTPTESRQNTGGDDDYEPRSRYADDAMREASRMDRAEERIVNNLRESVGTAPTRESVLEERTRSAKATTDAIKESFNEALMGVDRAGERRSARVRALNTASGLQGSDFASAAAERADMQTDEERNAILRERDSKVQAILANIPTEADDAFVKLSEAYRNNATGALDQMTAFRERQKSTAGTALAAIAASGASFDQLRKSPSYRSILSAYGGDENAVKGAFVSSIPEKQKLGSTTVGNKYVTFYYDPQTGAKSSVEFELPIAPGGNQEVAQVFSNGQFALKTTTVDPVTGGMRESIEIVTPKGGLVQKTTGGGGGEDGGDLFSPEEERDIRKAGLANADQQTRILFSQTSPEFQKAYITNGFGNSEVTPEILLRNYEEWEANNGDGGDGDVY